MIVYLQLIDTAEDRSKFEQLYEQYKQLMFYTAFQILKRPQDAEDAVHLAFLSIAENISRISDLDCPKTRAHIVTIVERKAIDMLRAERRHPSVPLDESINGVSVEYGGDSALAKAILELPAAYRQCILLKFYHGYSTKEIAGIMHLSLANTSKLLQRAKAKLKEIYQEGGESL